MSWKPSCCIVLLCFFVLVCLPPISGNPELVALIDLKAALDPGGRILTSWANSGDHCGGTFEGVVCNEHGKVSNISLQVKGLQGTLSPAIAGLKCLSGLYLHFNSISGKIPVELGNLTELSDLYLNMNNLSGEIPPELGGMTSLQVLQLSYNHLSGSIPAKLGHLEELTTLSVQSNRLAGTIPGSLGDLKKLVRVNLSFNQLSGSIPTKLIEIPQLKYLDVRSNKLSGVVPSDLKRLNGGFQYENNTDLCGVGFDLLRVCMDTNQFNPNTPIAFVPNSTDLHQIPQSAYVNLHCPQSNCSHSSKFTVIVIVGVLAGTGTTFCSVLAILWYRRRKQRIGNALENSESQFTTDHTRDSSHKGASPLCHVEYATEWDPLDGQHNKMNFSQDFMMASRFNLSEIESATQYFSELNLLGKSNFAAVYRGILRDGSVGAIKSINKGYCKLDEVEFLKGLEVLASLQHENLVKLRGFCCSKGRGECFLVYDYAMNGSLMQFLDVSDGSGKFLDWSTRVSIIEGIARGLEYLHSNKPEKPSFLHQNLSVRKVLLDQHFNPLLLDSGIQKILADDVIYSSLKTSAAMGYLAPEYITTGRFTEKSDVYAFGVIVLQIISGKTAITHMIRFEVGRNKLKDAIDEQLCGKYVEHEAEHLIKIALECINETPEERPSMEAVVERLSKG